VKRERNRRVAAPSKDKGHRGKSPAGSTILRLTPTSEAQPATRLPPPYVYKEKVTGDEIVWWIEHTLRVPEGKLTGKPFLLDDWQKTEIKRIYDNEVPTRRAILSFGRKNGKTSLAACFLLLHLCGPLVRANSSLYSTAQSREQAAILFNLAAKMVRMSDMLMEFVHIKDTTRELLCKAWGTRYRALASEANTAFGLSPVFVVHDELGQVHGPRFSLYEALETATGAQENPLSIIISTQAPTDGDLLSILIDDAMAEHDPRTICSLYTAPDDEDPFDIETIRKANPALGHFLNETEVLAMAEDAKRMPAREPEFRNLILNQRVEALAPFVSTNMWKACGNPPEDISGVPIYAGLDLSEVRDLTAFVMIGNINKVWHVHPTFWLPSASVKDLAKRDRIPYDLWEKHGFLRTTPGKTIQYDYIAKFLYKMFKEYNIVKLAFDRWNMKHLKPWLVQAGFREDVLEEKFIEFGQGTQSMSPALRELEEIILDEHLAHGMHPVLSMCAANAVIEGKDSSNRKLSKARSSGRIDGMVALAMAIGVAPLKPKVIDIEAMIG
jgi:phage terminase large subunit-like protein